jgi:TonB family protein
MIRREHYFWAAVCVSLLLHIAALAVAAQAGSYARIWLPPLRTPEDTVIVSLQKPPVIHDDMGDRAGTGTASSSSEGPTPLQGKQADQDQPMLTREPTGPAKLGKAQPSNLAPGERGHGGQRGQLVIQVPPDEITPPAKSSKPIEALKKPSPSPAPAPALAVAMKSPEKSPKASPLTIAEPKPPTTAPAEQVATVVATPSPPLAVSQRSTPKTVTPSTPPNQAVQAQQATGDGLAPGRATAADPAQQSDSESDPFTTTGAAVFHDGRLRVRSGRKIKTVRPQILVPGILDAIGESDPSVVLKINIDVTGKVTQVGIVHSSGSNDIDQPCVVAVYDWWFEPARDAAGKTVPDVVLFTISFR